VKRWLLRIVLLAAAVAGAALVVATVALRASLALLDGQVHLSGLSHPVTVTRDALGVPTLRGHTREDVALATGFVHAQERFFQMDLLRRLAAGELSELVGRAALEKDRSMRLHGLRRVALQVVAQADPRSRKLIEAYARGVNAGLAALGARPPEYFLLAVSPRPWQDEDAVLAVLAMFHRLSDADAKTDARRGRVRECLPAPVAAFLSADDPEWAATLDGAPLLGVPMPQPADYDLRGLEGVDFDVGRRFGETLAADPGLPRGASNAWAVSGALTDDGRALVANDMHLGLALPNIWFRMRLVVEGPHEPVDVSGVSLPGGPAIVTGSNGKVAWAFTNSYGDWSDRVALEPDPADEARYRTPHGMRALTQRRETILVKGGASESMRIPESVWGPVTEDWRGRPVAVRWLAHHPEAVNLTILEMEQAGNLDQALDVAARMGIPPQNLVAGDAQGRVGWTIAGRIPRRREGYDPTAPYAGSTPDAGWSGWLPATEYPRIVDPEGGHIWTANHQVVTGAALRRIGDGGYWHGARARQIRDGLRALGSADERDMLRIQLDDRALLLGRWHRVLSDLLRAGDASAHPRGEEFREALATWNGRASSDAVAYRLVWAFRMRLRDVVFAAITAPCRKRVAGYRFEGFRQDEGPLWRLVSERPAHLLHPGYRDWGSLLDAVAVETIDYFAGFEGPFLQRSWGEHNRAHLRHPLSRALPALAPLLDIGPDGGAGDRNMPRVMAFGDGASERFAVRPGREEAAFLHMPGGQSGHFLSPFYRAGHTAWLTGRPTRFLPGATVHTLVLDPG
jgi:penicillin amidase